MDGQIAKLRLDAARDLIPVEFPPPATLDSERKFEPDFRWPPVWWDEAEITEDDYEISRHMVVTQLREMAVLPDAFCDKMSEYLYQYLLPYRMPAHRAQDHRMREMEPDRSLSPGPGVPAAAPPGGADRSFPADLRLRLRPVQASPGHE